MNQAPITINGNWVQTVSESIPNHAKDIKLNLDTVMTRHGLEPVDAHACAYAAAIASSNGGLAFEIEMNSPLFTADAERDAMKAAAALMGMNTTYYPFVEMCGDEQMKTLPYGLRVNTLTSFAGVSKKKFTMYALAASIVGKCEYSIKSNYDILKAEGVSIQQIQAIARIAAVVHAIGKVAV